MDRNYVDVIDYAITMYEVSFRDPVVAKFNLLWKKQYENAAMQARYTITC